MKRFSVLTIITTIILFSCKKNETTPLDKNDSNRKSYVKVRITNFVQSIEELSTARSMSSVISARDSSLHNKVQHIYYMLYDNNNNELVKYLTQSYASDSTSFGIYEDSLQQGSYLLMVVASQHELNINSAQNPDSIVLVGSYVSYPTELLPWADVFAKKNTFEIGADDDTIDIELDRIVGKLEVRLADASYPFYDISIEVQGEYNQFNLSTSQPELGGSTMPMIKMNRINDTTFSNFILNTTTDFSVNIIVKNLLTGIIVNKNISNVRCYMNRRTIISGKIESFDPNLPFGVPQLTIQINNIWDNDGPTYNY